MGSAGLLAVWLIASAAGLPHGERMASSQLDLATVTPTVAGKNQVRWWQFDWRSVELKPLENGAPVRLFFYEQERSVARVAAALTSQTFEEYATLFRHVPSTVTPLLLYNSHFEFESTNAFYVSEHLLGVTSTADRTLALPYWGDHARFKEVLRHELAHVFTLSKVNSASASVGLSSPLPVLPLWFIEGLAQEAALGDLTPDALAALVEAVREDDLPEMLDESAGSFERVYLVGHAQALFLEDTYGDGTWLRLLELLPSRAEQGRATWPTLLGEATGAPVESVEAAWRDWAERRTRVYLGWDQPVADLAMAGIGRIDRLHVSPDGRTLLFRAFDPLTARAALWLRDVDDPDSLQLIVEDSRIGLESLHPLDRGVAAIQGDLLAYAGRSGSRDRIHVRRWQRRDEDGHVTFDLGEERTLQPNGESDLIEVGSLAFSPDGSSLAFVALSRTSGLLDVWRIDDPMSGEARFSRITDDAAAERDLSWSPDGLYWVSDATSDGGGELFRHSFADGTTLRLTDFPGEGPSGPRALTDGRVLFTAGGTGLEQAYLRDTRGIVRVTSVTAGLDQAVLDHSGRLLGVAGAQDRTKLVAVAPEALSHIPTLAFAQAPMVALRLPEQALGPGKPYEALSMKNLSLANVQLFASSGPFLVGEVVFTDRLRDRIIAAGAQYVQDVDQSAVRVLYADRTRRLGWSGAAFFDNSLQLDPTRLAAGETYLLRRYGVQGELYWPFGRYTRFEAFLAPQGWGAVDFSAPSGGFAQANQGTVPALTAGVRLAMDTLRYQPAVGPVNGTSASLTLSGTGILRADESFFTVAMEALRYQPFSRRFPRVYLYGRLGAVLQPGGDLTGQLFLPPAWNLRAYRFADISVVTRHYALATLELRFPLLPAKPGWPSLEAMAGGDVGSLFFDVDDALDNRVADVAVGVNLGLGFFTVRLHFARPIDVGGVELRQRWNTHLSIWSPFLML